MRKGFLAAMILLLALGAITGAVEAYAFVDVPAISMQHDNHAAQQARQPEANLPFLFAVFFITWAAFFAYVFYMSRRQREMQREIEALKRALAERDKIPADAESRPSSRT